MGNAKRSVKTGKKPSRAFTYRVQEQWAVFRLEDDKAVFRFVELGLRNDLFAEVISGLDDGDEVIIYPANEIEDGTRVQRR